MNFPHFSGNIMQLLLTWNKYIFFSLIMVFPFFMQIFKKHLKITKKHTEREEICVEFEKWNSGIYITLHERLLLFYLLAHYQPYE